MKHLFTFFASALLLAAAGAGEKLVLAKDGKSNYTIGYDTENRDPVFRAALKDLSGYLREITGASVPLAYQAGGPRIHVGTRAPGDDAPFTGVRERRIKSVGKDLYIYGDGRFGTIGAVYDFLEKFCGCRWFGPWPGDTFVPKKPTLEFDAIDYKHAPSFHSLELGGPWPLARVHTGIQDYLRRNRCFLQPSYSGPHPQDGWRYFGPTCHGLAAFFPPGGHKPGSFENQWAGAHLALADKAYFKDHPEYFTLNKEGKRVPDRQLCFSNPDVRRILTENIETVLKYEKYGANDYAIIDLAFNDRSGGFCECKNCKALEQKYQSPGGAYYDYLIELGNAFLKKHPRLTIRMIAYQPSMTGIPPKPGTKFPANVSVIVAPLVQDFSKPLSHPYNVKFRKEFEAWGKIAGKMWWWSYPVLYPHGIRAYALFPGVWRNDSNIKFAHKNGTRYIISEMGGSLVHNCAFKKLNDYLQVRLADDVNDSVDRIVKEYCDHCFGPASDLMIKYLRETDAESVKDPNYFIYYDDPRAMRSLHSPANLVRWQGYFDEMMKLVGDNPYYRLQIGRARINLDALTLLTWNNIKVAEPAFATRANLDAVHDRYVAEVNADSNDVWTGRFRNAYGQVWERNTFLAAGEGAYRSQLKDSPVPPELVKKYGKGNVTAVGIDGRAGNFTKRLSEADAANGLAVEVKLVDAKIVHMPTIMERQKDGSFSRTREAFVPFEHNPFLKKCIPTYKAAKGYRPYLMGRIKLTAAETVV
ncbi:MAG: DUF4838 domain-containing protein, partial [Lentisphaeria bacterium]|nr:DUF4838 domain-containing protein [Lentisphaeria bacterium]